jgi:hypothetical protein
VPPPWKSPSPRRIATGVDLPPCDVDDGGTDPTTTSVLLASVTIEVHGCDSGCPDVDAGWWNPDGGGVILAAWLGNRRRGWGGGV